MTDDPIMKQHAGLTGPEAEAFADLTALTQLGCRFHGSAGNAAAADWLCAQVKARTGVDAVREVVDLPGWDPGEAHGLHIETPVMRTIEAWPLLWSGGSHGIVEGHLRFLGSEGLWGDSMVWNRFAVVDDAGELRGYVLGRHIGPAAPQPLPAGSDTSIPHLSVGHLDGLQLKEWLDDGIDVRVSFTCESSHGGVASGDNIIVDLPATEPRADGGRSRTILVCAHYDTYYNTVGAYDNGSGTIALLRLIERLADARAVRPHPLRFVFFTAEEWHLLGSRTYVERHADELDDLAYVYNIDGLGRGDFIELFSAPETLAWRFDAEVRAHARMTRPGMRVESRFPPTIGTDDASFYKAGIPTVYMTINDLFHLHQPNDLPEPDSARNIAWAVDMVARLLERLPVDERLIKPGIL